MDQGSWDSQILPSYRIFVRIAHIVTWQILQGSVTRPPGGGGGGGGGDGEGGEGVNAAALQGRCSQTLLA